MDTNVKPDAYAVWDIETNTWWDNGRNKKTWEKPGHAKNSWNVGRGWRGNDPVFNDQTRFVVKPVRLVAID